MYDPTAAARPAFTVAQRLQMLTSPAFAEYRRLQKEWQDALRLALAQPRNLDFHEVHERAHQAFQAEQARMLPTLQAEPDFSRRYEAQRAGLSGMQRHSLAA